jgi:hypothetical protein
MTDAEQMQEQEETEHMVTQEKGTQSLIPYASECCGLEQWRRTLSCDV